MVGRLIRLAAMVAILFSLPAGAQNFPSRPILLINPFAPGGSIDTHFRVLAAEMEKIFKTPVLVENKPGASATLGPATMAATAKPDGYTLSYLGAGIFTMPVMQKTSFDPAKDFTYIIHLAGNRLQIVMRTDAPWKTWKELAADARARPGAISYGSTGAGSSTHLAIETISLAAGVKFLHVPFRGTGEVLTALLGEHVRFGASGGPARPLIESGQLRAVLGSSRERNPKSPDVPSLSDEGLEASIDLAFPYGIGGPRGMDPAVVKTLHDGIRKAAVSPEHLAVLDQLDLENRYLDTAAYRLFAMEQIEGHRKLIEKIGLAKE